ncbi:MAG: polysaccharide deacetylase family protein [Puniceicoccales bacterium]
MKNPKIPWTEKLCPLRAPLDILTGCYPAFLFGGALSRKILPVFHFHEVTPDYLEPYLRYLSENGYRCANVDELLGILSGRESIPEKTVLLTFDDAWTSLWTVAAPLLKKYGLQAVTFAVPGRVSERQGVRETLEENPGMTDFGDRGDEPFCRWNELTALDESGVIEVESHTFAHEQIPVGTQGDSPVWTGEDLRDTPLLTKPLVWKSAEEFRPIDEREIGQTRWVTRSRMSDARAWIDSGRPESAEEMRTAIRRDLSLCRERIEARLNRPARILCFPWAVAGEVAREEARDVGYRAAFSDSFPGKRYVHPEADPFRLMRLKHNWIFQLPGQGRRRIPLPK